MDYSVDVVLRHQRLDCLVVADVGLHEHVVFLVLNVLEVGQVACIRQLVEVDDAVLRIFVHEQAYYMRADEAGSARYHYASLECHFFVCFSINMLDSSHIMQTSLSPRGRLRRANIPSFSSTIPLFRREWKSGICRNRSSA